MTKQEEIIQLLQLILIATLRAGHKHHKCPMCYLWETHDDGCPMKGLEYKYIELLNDIKGKVK